MVAADIPPPATRPFDRRFVLVVASALSYFLGLGVLAPVLPRYVEDVLHGSGAEVGVAVGVFAVSAALLRPVVGRIGDRRGRRVLLVGGALAAAVASVGYGLPGGLAVLVVFRLLHGAGEAFAFIGAATTAQDLAPPNRRGQAASLFSISVYGGLSFGPVLGEWVYRHHGPGWAWTTSAACSLLGAVLALGLPDFVDLGTTAPPASTEVAPSDGTSEPTRARWLHPAGLRPGVILALGASGYAGFASFVPLYVDEIGVDGAGPVFFEYGALVLLVRILASRLPDTLGSRRGPLAALALQATGLLVMGVWAAPAGLYTATAVYAFGVSLLYPALFPAVIDAAPDAERSQAIATFTLFFDLSQGLGAPVLGILVSVTTERAAFVGAAVLSAVGFVLHQRFASGSPAPAPLATGAVTAAACPPAEPGE